MILRYAKLNYRTPKFFPPQTDKRLESAKNNKKTIIKRYKAECITSVLPLSHMDSFIPQWEGAFSN